MSGGPNVYVDSSSIMGQTASLTGETARYILTVLRYGIGSELYVFDERGRYFKGTVTSTSKNSLQLSIIPHPAPNTESPLSITLCQGLLKGSKMDLVVQKAVELGVKRIIPLTTDRTQLDHTRKIDRWRKIAKEASRQSMRVVVPEICETMDFTELTNAIHANAAAAVVFYEAGGRRLGEIQNIEIKKDAIYVVIGSEGGFTAEEVNRAEQAGAIVASLGRRILRAETAAISALTLIQYLFGDIGSPQ